MGDSVTPVVIVAWVGANPLFLQSRGSLCLGAGFDMVTIDLIERFGVVCKCRSVLEMIKVGV